MVNHSYVTAVRDVASVTFRFDFPNIDFVNDFMVFIGISIVFSDYITMDG